VIVHAFLAFLTVSLLVIVTPGQDTALTIRNSLSGGRRGGVCTAAGVATGQLTWAIATGAGLSALVVASHGAFVALRLAGAAYLVYLGTKSIHAAIRSDPQVEHLPTRPARGATPARAYRQGVISNLSNPKIAAFFTGMLPAFAGPRPGFVALVALGTAFATMTLAWLTAYTVVVARLRDVVRRTRVRRALEAATGTTLLALGARVATERR